MKEPKAHKSINAFKALEKLLEKEHISAIQDGVARSAEHTFSIASYAKEKDLADLKNLESYGPSAFDEGTIQDLKFHERADEIYFVLKGSMRIFWKSKSSGKFNDILALTDNSDRYAYIPSGHCLLVPPNESARFLAIAMKTEKSTIKNGGKKLGKECPYYQNGGCLIRHHCEDLRKNRSDFF